MMSEFNMLTIQQQGLSPLPNNIWRTLKPNAKADKHFHEISFLLWFEIFSKLSAYRFSIICQALGVFPWQQAAVIDWLSVCVINLMRKNCMIGKCLEKKYKYAREMTKEENHQKNENKRRSILIKTKSQILYEVQKKKPIESKSSDFFLIL